MFSRQTSQTPQSGCFRDADILDHVDVYFCSSGSLSKVAPRNFTVKLKKAKHAVWPQLGPLDPALAGPQVSSIGYLFVCQLQHAAPRNVFLLRL